MRIKIVQVGLLPEGEDGETISREIINEMEDDLAGVILTIPDGLTSKEIEETINQRVLDKTGHETSAIFWTAIEPKDRIDRILYIISELLDDGLQQWASSATHDDDDFHYFDTLKAQDSFVRVVLPSVDTDAQMTLVSALASNVQDTFQSLTALWSDEELRDTPAIVQGLQNIRNWY
jgi:hypothetical protein